MLAPEAWQLRPQLEDTQHSVVLAAGASYHLGTKNRRQVHTDRQVQISSSPHSPCIMTSAEAKAEGLTKVHLETAIL